MTLLLDTCVALWAAVSPEKLSPKAAQLLQDGGNECFLSAVSVWELSAKYGLGKLSLPEPPPLLVPKLRAEFNFTPLAFDDSAAVLGGTLPFHHRDPFDRMLVSLAIVNGMRILTPDTQFQSYPVLTIWD